MAYNERIKSFERIREYMREFYVYGFKSREQFSQKSVRSYDDEKRRIESWLGDYMSFRQTPDGKNCFLSIDSRACPHNPLFKAWKTSSFTDGDITLHFILFDILYSPDVAMTVSEIMDEMNNRYLSFFEEPISVDESTLRKKLKEYTEAGLFRSEREGRQVRYRRVEDTDFSEYTDLLDFFSEVAPCGVIGSFLLDKGRGAPEAFAYKHHYITHALDSEVLCDLFLAMREKREVTLENQSRRGQLTRDRVVPLRIFISAQNGRQYVLAFSLRIEKIRVFRTDYLRSVEIGEPNDRFDELREKLDRMGQHMWGVMTRKNESRTQRILFDVHIDDGEEYIIQRLEREKRCGTVERLDEQTYRFTADVYDPIELNPWIRSYFCRIVNLEFSDRDQEEQFRSDFRAMARMYDVETEPAAGEGDST
ncbi:WYL domain-containing transcriptional regulator [Candidatus Saccharibacteria bacterium]|jgi:DNA-binding transcriptional ArsR family regulator|nr:WYL domain-containing transcriptional regulator [Candidatus Saccharibacteria bacterium]